MPKKRKKSKFQYVTPVLFIRTEEERQKIIANKISLILAENEKNRPENSYETNSHLYSDYLNHFSTKQSTILELNSLEVDLLNTEKLYVKDLKLSPSTVKCGSLLKDWSKIPGREVSPLRIVKEKEGSKYTEQKQRTISPDLFESDQESFVNCSRTEGLLEIEANVTEAVSSFTTKSVSKSEVSNDTQTSRKISKNTGLFKDEESTEKSLEKENKEVSLLRSQSTGLNLESSILKEDNTTAQELPLESISVHNCSDVLKLEEVVTSNITINEAEKVSESNSVIDYFNNQTSLDLSKENTEKIIKSDSLKKTMQNDSSKLDSPEDVTSAKDKMLIEKYLNIYVDDRDTSLDSFTTTNENLWSNHTDEVIKTDNGILHFESFCRDGENLPQECVDLTQSSDEEQVVEKKESCNEETIILGESVNVKDGEETSHENKHESSTKEVATEQSLHAMFEMSFQRQSLNVTDYINEILKAEDDCFIPENESEQQTNQLQKDTCETSFTKHTSFDSIKSKSSEDSIYISDEELNCSKTAGKEIIISDDELDRETQSINEKGTPKTSIIIKTTNVTPMPDYDRMDTPNVTKELQKYGVKAMKRKRGVQLLKYIYDSTHPIVDQEQVSDEDRKVVKRKRVSQTELSSDLKIVGNEITEK